MIELAAADIPKLQSFYEANPQYWHQNLGAAPSATEAQDDCFSMPPAGWPMKRKWALGFERDGRLLGAADIISDLFVEGVWHLGFFMVATALHGDGTAHRMYAVLESWQRAQGATWLRLGVVIGNARAQAFWLRLGYVEVRRRLGVRMGERVNDIRTMVKPLTGESIAAYLGRVVRDRPETE